jgi:site-specific DNA recombinase
MKFKIGLYLRKSSGIKKDNISIKLQLKNGIEFCKKMKFDYEVYDEVISGGDIDRKEFNRMINDCENDVINGVWVFEFDRLSRNMENVLMFRNVCIEYDIKFWVGFNEYDFKDDNDRLNIGFRSLLSEDERYKIRRRMMRGKKNKLNEGKYIVGNVGFGYKRIDGEIFINKDEGEYVKEIYRIYLLDSVKNYNDVLIKLKKKFNKNYNNKVGRSLIVKILNNNRYCGSSIVKFDGEEYVYNYEKLISEDDFNLVNKKLIRLNSLRKRKESESDYLLKGKINCGSCKDLMWIVGSRYKLSDGSFKEYRYYSCNNGLKSVKGKWNNKIIKEDCNSFYRNKINIQKLEKVVWNILFEVISNSESVLEEYKLKYKEDKFKEKEYKNKIIYYRNKIKKDEVKFLKKLDILIENNIDLDKKLKIDFENEKIEDEKRIIELEDFISKLNLLDNDKLIDNKVKDELLVVFEDDSFKNKSRFLNKYVNNVEVLRLDNNVKNVKYNIIVNFNFGDKIFDINNDNNINNRNISLIDGKFVYILENGDLEIWRL